MLLLLECLHVCVGVCLATPPDIRHMPITVQRMLADWHTAEAYSCSGIMGAVEVHNSPGVHAAMHGGNRHCVFRLLWRVGPCMYVLTVRLLPVDVRCRQGDTRGYYVTAPG